MDAPHPADDTGTTTATDLGSERTLIGQIGQYAVTELLKLDGVRPGFDTYELIIRGHTKLMVGEQPDAVTPTGEPESVEPLSIAFDAPIAVEDIGIELLRASHIVVPLKGINVLEELTGVTYDDTRWIENPLNYTPAFRNEPVTYPETPLTADGLGDSDDDDNGGGLIVT